MIGKISDESFPATMSLALGMLASGAAKLLVMQLEYRFGDIDLDLVKSVEQAHFWDVRRWAKRVLDPEMTLEQILEGPRRPRAGTGEKMMAGARQLGIEEGIAEGFKKGVLKQLQLRFGDLHAGVAERVRAADMPLLTLWADRIPDAKTLDQVFED